MTDVQPCFQCGNPGTVIHGYPLCAACKSKLGLLTDDTIRRHIQSFKKTSVAQSYEGEIQNRLVILEQEYIKKKIKLTHVQDRIDHIKSSNKR